MQRVKVGLLIASLRTGGKEYMTVNMLKHMDKTRFDPFLCVMKGGELLEQVAEERVYSHLMRFRGDVLGFAWRLFRILRRERPQVLLCLSYRIPGWVGRLWGKLLGVPVIIYELHGVERVGERDLDVLDRVLFDRLTDHMIAIGDDMRQNFMRDGVAAHKITVIRNGIDTEQFYPMPEKRKQSFLGFAPDTPVIGCITKMRPKKNLPMLVDAFAQVLENVPDARLVIAGDGSERGKLETHIADLGLQESVHLLGLRGDIPDLLNAFDVIALSSTTEAAPLVILEAGACGVPVVSTTVGDIPHMILDGKTGFLVPARDTNALAERITQILCDPALQKSLGEAARAHVLQNFSIQASVRAREALFLKLLADKTGHK